MFGLDDLGFEEFWMSTFGLTLLCFGLDAPIWMQMSLREGVFHVATWRGTTHKTI